MSDSCGHPPCRSRLLSGSKREPPALLAVRRTWPQASPVVRSSSAAEQLVELARLPRANDLLRAHSGQPPARPVREGLGAMPPLGGCVGGRNGHAGRARGPAGGVRRVTSSSQGRPRRKYQLAPRATQDSEGSTLAVIAPPTCHGGGRWPGRLNIGTTAADLHDHDEAREPGSESWPSNSPAGPDTRAQIDSFPAVSSPARTGATHSKK